MKIGLIDNELCTRKRHNFPNLAIMKLSTYYKSIGADVELINFDKINPSAMFSEGYDKVFISKVFTDTITPEWVDELENTEKGGTGFYYDKAEPLPYDIEHSMPDYSIYDSVKSCKHSYYKDYSIGFITRGCVRQCLFCVNKNSKQVLKNSELHEFVDPKRPYIMLLDDNITAYKGFYDVFNDLDSLNIPFVFKQGMDFRILNPKKMQRLWNSNYLCAGKTQSKGSRTFHFAFDNIDDYDLIKKRLKQYYFTKPYSFKIFMYVLVGFDRGNLYNELFFLNDFLNMLRRIELLFKYSAYPYIMIHKDISKSPYEKIIKRMRGMINAPLLITNKTMHEALTQSSMYDCIKIINKHRPTFLDIKFNSKLYRS